MCRFISKKKTRAAGGLADIGTYHVRIVFGDIKATFRPRPESHSRMSQVGILWLSDEKKNLNSHVLGGSEAIGLGAKVVLGVDMQFLLK
jgi:hypothetical protein